MLHHRTIFCLPKNVGPALFGFVFALSSLANPTIAGDGPPISREPQLRDTVLANGLTLLVFEEKTTPAISLLVAYDAGSRFDPPGKSGLAKVGEKMMAFGSAGYRAGEYARLLHAAGGSYQHESYQDLTFFSSRFPKDRLREVVLMEADRMENPLISFENVERAKAAVDRDRLTQEESSPYGPLVRDLFGKSYTTHPYGKSPWGVSAEVASITVSDTRAWLESHIQPANATIAVVGDVRAKDFFLLMSEIFGGIPSAPKPGVTLPVEPGQSSERRAAIPSTNNVPVFIAGFHTPDCAHADGEALKILADILIGEKSSRVNRRLVNEAGVALFAGGNLLGLAGDGLLYFFAFMNVGHTTAEGEKILYEELARAARGEVSEADLAIAKNQLIAETYRETSGGDALAFRIVFGHLFSGDGLFWHKRLAMIKAVTLADVSRVAAQYLSPENRTVITLEPVASTTSSAKGN